MLSHSVSPYATLVYSIPVIPLVWLVTFEFVSLLFCVFVLFLIFCVFQYIPERIAFVDVGVIRFVFELSLCLVCIYVSHMLLFL